MPGIPPPSSARSAPRGCFIQRMRLHLPEMGVEKVPSRNAPLRYPKMHFEDASPRAFRLRRRRGDDYCRVQPTSVCLFGAVGLWAMRRCGASGTGCRRWCEWRRSGRSMSRCRCRCGCGRGCRCCPPVLRGFGGRLGHCVLYSVGVLLAHRVLHGVDMLFGHRALRALAGAVALAPPSLRALTAAMRIARKRNRSPQNGAERDDGSSQRSLL